MAHLIENLDGKDCMAYTGKKPWHGLGTEVPEDATPEQILIAAGLNWGVEKRPILDSKTGLVIPDHYAITRTSDDKVFEMVRGRYVPTQNSDVFAFFDKFVKEMGSMTMETAGSIDGGKRVWGLAKMKNQNFHIANKNDEIESYLLIMSPFERGESLQVMYTPTRVVCNNTLTYALNNKSADGVFRMRHTKNFDAVVHDEAAKALGLSLEYMKDFKETAEFLASKKITDRKVGNFFAKLVQPELIANGLDNILKKQDEYNSKMRSLMQSYEVQPGAEMSAGTYWTAFNAVTYFYDHHAGREQNTRVRNLMNGSGAVMKQKAFALATQMAKAA